MWRPLLHLLAALILAAPAAAVIGPEVRQPGEEDDAMTTLPSLMKENELTLRDRLGWNWQHELISLPVSFAPGKVTGRAVAVRSDAGELMAGQLEAISTHPDGSVATATCWFHADLPEFAARTWSVDPETPPPASDLRLEQADDGALLLSNAKVVVKLPGPGSPPGTSPLMAVRGGDGVWRGAGRMEGPPAEGPVVEIESSGPVFARVRSSYQYPNGGSYQVTVELRAGEDAILAHEVSDSPEGAAFVFDLGKTFDRGFWRAHSPSHGKSGDHEIDFGRESASGLIPFYAWNLDLASWYTAHSSDAAIGDWLAVFAILPDLWRGGRDARILVETGRAGLRFRFAQRDYERYWGIIPFAVKGAGGPGQAAIRKCMSAQVRFGQTPLERARHMSLEWERPADSYQPHLVTTAEELPRVRQKLRDDVDLKRFFDEHVQAPGKEGDPAGAYVATGDDAYARAAANRVLGRLRDWVRDFLSEGYYGNLMAIGLTRPVRCAAVDWDLVAASPAVSDEERAWADAAFAFLAEELSDPNYWPSDERGFVKGNVNFYSDQYTCLGAIACLLTGHPRRAEWLQWVEGRLNHEFLRWVHPSGAWEEAPNYQGATMAMLLPAIRMLRLNGYTGFTGADALKATMRFMGELQTPRDVRTNMAQLPSVGDTTLSLHSQSLQNMFAWAAKVYADDPGFAGAMMWYWEQGGGIRCGVHDGFMVMGGWSGALLMVDPDIPALAPRAPRASVRLDGYGVRLSQTNAAGEETYFLLKCGEAANHYDPDELSFHYYARGVPMALDYGCMYQPSISQPWYHNRVSFDHRAEYARGDLMDFVAMDAADYVAGEMAINYLERMPETPDDPHGRADQEPPQRVDSSAWERRVLLSRAGDYLVISDKLDSTLPTDWSLHVLATGAEVAGNRVHFPGQLGVDLDLYLDGRPNDKLVTGEWGYSQEKDGASLRYCSLQPIVNVAHETQHFVRLHRSPGEDYRALMLPRKPEDAPVNVDVLDCGYRLSGPGWQEWALLNGPLTVVAEEQWPIVADDELRFRGRAALVRRTDEATTLCLLSGDQLSLGPYLVEALGPISLTYRPDSVTGLSRGVKKRVTVYWLKTADAEPELLVDGQPHGAAYNVMRWWGRPLHQLVFTLPEGEHQLQIKW